MCTVMKVLLNIYIRCSVVSPREFSVRLRLHHTNHHSQHSRSGHLQSTDRDQYRQVRLFDTDSGCSSNSTWRTCIGQAV